MQKFLMYYVKKDDDKINCSVVTSDDLAVIMSYKNLLDIHNITGLPYVEDNEDLKQWLRNVTLPDSIEIGIVEDDSVFGSDNRVQDIPDNDEHIQ